MIWAIACTLWICTALMYGIERAWEENDNYKSFFFVCMAVIVSAASIFQEAGVI